MHTRSLLPLLLLALALPASHIAWASESTAVVQEIDQQEHFAFQEGGARFDVTVERGPRRATRAGIERWLRAAARTVSGLHGRFPVPQVRVTVKPGGRSGDPVIFGQAVRREEERLDLFLCRTATDDELPGEWVAIHEMIHLAFPRIDRTDAWINEGFVTYYQEVLRTRGGFQSEPEGWGKLADGFYRGASRGSGLPLVEESRLMQRTHGYWRVYWGGAAMALDMDLELRRRTGGKRSLDDVYLLRIEQYYPFPAIAMVKELERFKQAEIVWCQEEPKNQGAWNFIEPNIEWVLTRIGAKHSRPAYAGRPASASPATGLASQHKAQQQALVDAALTIEGK